LPAMAAAVSSKVGASSFPSQHATVSWAIASVIAHEYPGPLTQILAYGVAGGVSAARVAGQKHFLSDALVGSALGWYLGRQTFRSHSQYTSGDLAKWGTFRKGYEIDTGRDMRNEGSQLCSRGQLGLSRLRPPYRCRLRGRPNGHYSAMVQTGVRPGLIRSS